MVAGKTKTVVVCCAFPERGDCTLESGSAKENAIAREIFSRHGFSEKIDTSGNEQQLQAYSFFTRNEYGKAFPMFRSMAESGDGESRNIFSRLCMRTLLLA